jgi:hypothetical protein
MQYVIILFSIVTLALAFLATNYENQKNKKKLKLTISSIFIVGVLTVCAQAYREINIQNSQDYNDSIQKAQLKIIEKKSDTIRNLEIISMKKTDSLLIHQNKMLWKQNQNFKVSNEILNYSTGGKDNKPVVNVQMGNLATNSKSNNSYSIKFCINNYGKYPLESVRFSIDDYYTAQFKILAHQGKYNIKDVDTTRELNHLEYEKKQIFGTIKAKGKVCEYTGYILGGVKELSYNASVDWKNGSYRLFYHLKFNDEKKIFEIIETRFGVNGKEVNPKVFFPLTPKYFWEN